MKRIIAALCIALLTLSFPLNLNAIGGHGGRGKNLSRGSGDRNISKGSSVKNKGSSFGGMHREHDSRRSADDHPRNPRADEHFQKKHEQRTGRREERRDKRKEAVSERRDDRKEAISERRDSRKETISERRDDRKEAKKEQRDKRKDAVSERRDKQADHWERHKKNQRRHREERRRHSRRVRDDFWYHHDRWDDQWRGYNHYYGWYHYDHGNWWVGATFGFISGFMTAKIISNKQPVRYVDNGVDVIYIEGSTVYINGEAKGSTEQYASEAKEIANNVPEVDPSTIEMTSLGVWALSQSTDTEDTPTMYVQLAISKEGIIAGMYQNSVLKSVESLEGTVDPLTQRIAWHFVEKEIPVMETTLGDLTSEEGMAKVLVYFAGGQIQEWVMIRLDKD